MHAEGEQAEDEAQPEHERLATRGAAGQGGALAEVDGLGRGSKGRLQGQAEVRGEIEAVVATGQTVDGARANQLLGQQQEGVASQTCVEGLAQATARYLLVLAAEDTGGRLVEEVANTGGAVVANVVVGVDGILDAIVLAQGHGDALRSVGGKLQALAIDGSVFVHVVGQHARKIRGLGPETRAAANDLPGQQERIAKVRGAVVVTAPGRRLVVENADGGVTHATEQVVTGPHRIDLDHRHGRELRWGQWRRGLGAPGRNAQDQPTHENGPNNLQRTHAWDLRRVARNGKCFCIRIGHPALPSATMVELQQVAVLLIVAVVFVPLFRKLKLGSVLGYLAAGVLVGPYGLHLINHLDSIRTLSELGVVMLLFLIGLELNPGRLWLMRRAVFGLGGAQVLLTTLVLGTLSLVVLPAPAAYIAGFGMALSSTAFVLPILAERSQLTTPAGHASFAILLFQDLAVLPVLVVLPMLGLASEAGHTGGPWMMGGKIVVALVGLVLFGRFLIRPLFKLIATARSQEVLTAATLLIVIGTAWLMHSVGLSMSLGTFLAGVLLSESEYRHELQANIEPFKGLLLGLFFMAVGMSANLLVVRDAPLLLLGVTVGFMSLKALTVYGVTRLFGNSAPVAGVVATALPQGGEFAFVLFAIAVSTKLLPTQTSDFLTMSITLSMALTPVSLLVHDRILAKRLKEPTAPRAFDALPEHANRVVIAGFGRFGQIVARILRLRRIGFTALDAASTQVDFVRKFGNKIYYGDATRLDLLRAAQVDHAEVFVLAIDDVAQSLIVAELVRKHFPQVKIFARARNRQHAYQLLAMGIQTLYRETFESSLHMASDVLVGLGCAEDSARNTVDRFAAYDDQAIRSMYMHRDDQEQLIAGAKKYAEELETLFQSDEAQQSGAEDGGSVEK